MGEPMNTASIAVRLAAEAIAGGIVLFVDIHKNPSFYGNIYAQVTTF